MEELKSASLQLIVKMNSLPTILFCDFLVKLYFTSIAMNARYSKNESISGHVMLKKIFLSRKFHFLKTHQKLSISEK